MKKVCCPICDKENDSECSWAICEKHRALIKKGFVFVLECDPNTSKTIKLGHILIGGKQEFSTLNNVSRTGNFLTIERTVLENLIQKEPFEIQFIDPDGFKTISKLLRAGVLNE